MENERVAIIDGDSPIFFAFHPKKILDENNIPIKKEGKFVYEDKTHNEIKQSCDYLLNKLLINSQATHYILFVKGKGNFRYKYTDSYKANRYGKEPPKFWDFTKQYLIGKWKAVVTQNIESDDAVNICRLNIPNSFICAIDSDLLGLNGLHFNWKKNQWIETSKEEADYKFWSNIICGTHNCTKGIPGKGISFVDKLFTIKYGTKGEEYHNIVLQAFIDHFGEYEGIKEYFTNYISIKILENYEGFEIPKIIEYNNKIY